VVRFVFHALHDLVVATEEVTVAGARRDPGGFDLTQQIEWIVASPMPEGHIDGLKERAGLAAPAPPEVHGDGGQPFDARREVGNASLLGKHGQ
jgi:hypothetical protein